MHLTRLRIGLGAALLAVVVGASMMGTGSAQAQGCTGSTVCYVLALPDLRVTNVDADPLGTGQTRIEFWVKNEGTANANGGMYRVDIAGVGVWWGVLGSINAGSTKYYSFNITEPAAPPYSRNVQVCADATGKVTESDENDNCMTESVQTTALPIGGG
jgi:subtilase family serine protease